MTSSHARVEVEDPARWAKQLASHLGRRNRVEDHGDGSTIVFPDGRCALSPTDGALRLEITVDDAEALERLQHVVGSHFERFAQGLGVTVRWHRD